MKLTCMKAVAMITPDPKYLAKKKPYSMYLFLILRLASTGNKAPREMLAKEIHLNG
jgi:hypothetical protein